MSKMESNLPGPTSLDEKYKYKAASSPLQKQAKVNERARQHAARPRVSQRCCLSDHHHNGLVSGPVSGKERRNHLSQEQEGRDDWYAAPRKRKREEDACSLPQYKILKHIKLV